MSNQANTIQKSFFKSLEDLNLKRLLKDSDRTYKDLGGQTFPTFERTGLRLSLSSNSILYWTGRHVEIGYGEAEDVIIQAIIVDNDLQRQGKASQVMHDITELADATGVTLYVEPTPIQNGKMPISSLVSFYKKFGFERESEGTDRVLIRRHIK